MTELESTSRKPDRRNIRFPAVAREQDEEWFEYEEDGSWKKLRLHDYGGIFEVPGLYEDLVYHTLECSSPSRIVRMLTQVLEDWPESLSDLRVLDLGAGNGIVAERLAESGVRHVVGVDLLEEAARAAERDRPGAYEQYVVADLSDVSEENSRRLREARLNCLCTVAALGFGDIPPRAFATAFNHIESTGWLAMSIKGDFLSREDESGFSDLIRAMMAQRVISVESQFRYCHRLSLTGDKLFYVGLIARKLRDIPDDLLDAPEAVPQESDSQPRDRIDRLITDTHGGSSS